MIETKSKLLLVSVQSALYDWVQRELEGQVPPEHIIWRQHSEALPARPCVAMKITSGPKRVGFTDNVSYDVGNRFDIGGQREMVLSVQVFGSTRVAAPMAYQIGIDLSSSLDKLTVLDRLRSFGIAIQGKGGVENLSALEETEFEERSQFDVDLGVAENIVDEPGYIQQANITPHVVDA